VKNKRHRGSEGGLLDDTAATLRIHFGRSKPSRNSAIANVIMAANGAAVSTQKIHKFRGATNKLESAGAVESFVSSEETTPRPTRASEHSGRLRQHVSGRLKIPEPSLLGFGSVARIAHLSPTASPERTELERITVDALPSPQTVHFLIHFKQPCRWQRHCQSCHSRQTRGAGKSGRVVSGHSHQSGLFSFSISLSSAFQDGADADVTTSLLPGSHNLAYKKKGGMREKSRQMMKYVHEQRAARTLSIIVGAFIICWLPFFIVSPFMAICAQCVKNQDAVFAAITWAGHLNSMLNPLIYSRFSRDFRKARKAIKTPLNIVFAQLVSITQLWEPPEGQISAN